MNEEQRDFALLCDLPNRQLIKLGRAVTRFVGDNLPVVTVETLNEAAGALEDGRLRTSSHEPLEARKFAAVLRTRARWLAAEDED